VLLSHKTGYVYPETEVSKGGHEKITSILYLAENLGFTCLHYLKQNAGDL
jgi:hypothetical protein